MLIDGYCTQALEITSRNKMTGKHVRLVFKELAFKWWSKIVVK